VAQIDVVLGSWGAEPPIDDHVTFSCWQRAEGATAVDAPVATSGEPLLGECLTREEALAHRKVAEFWAVVDLLTEFDPTVYEAVYGGPPESLGRAVLRTLRRRLGV